MKKIISVLLVLVMCVSLGACSVETQPASSEEKISPTTRAPIVTNLTLDNYKEYFDIGHTETESGASFYSYVLTDFFYEKIQYGVKIEGLKQNCTYNDVQITISLEGAYGGISRYIDTTSDDDAITEDMIPFELKLSIQTDERGNGEGVQVLDPPSPYYTTLTLAALLDVKVISISGTVQENI